MSEEETHKSPSLPIYLAELDLANEVASEVNISIDFRPFLLTSSPLRNQPDAMISVYCKTQSDAARFERAFERRRWEDSKRPGGE